MAASTKVNLKTVNRQSNNCVRTAHTLHVGFEVPHDSWVGCVAQPRTRSAGYAGYGLLKTGGGFSGCVGFQTTFEVV